jgi:hypothetical protein
MRPIDRYRQIQNMKEDAKFNEFNDDDAAFFFMRVFLGFCFWAAILYALGIMP